MVGSHLGFAPMTQYRLVAWGVLCFPLSTVKVFLTVKRDFASERFGVLSQLQSLYEKFSFSKEASQADEQLKKVLNGF